MAEDKSAGVSFHRASKFDEFAQNLTGNKSHICQIKNQSLTGFVVSNLADLIPEGPAFCGTQKLRLQWFDDGAAIALINMQERVVQGVLRSNGGSRYLFASSLPARC